MGCWILDSTKACLCASALCVIPGGGGAFADSEDCVKPIEQAESTSQCMIECGTPELNGVTQYGLEVRVSLDFSNRRLYSNKREGPIGPTLGAY